MATSSGACPGLQGPFIQNSVSYQKHRHLSLSKCSAMFIHVPPTAKPKVTPPRRVTTLTHACARARCTDYSNTCTWREMFARLLCSLRPRTAATRTVRHLCRAPVTLTQLYKCWQLEHTFEGLWAVRGRMRTRGLTSAR